MGCNQSSARSSKSTAGSDQLRNDAALDYKSMSTDELVEHLEKALLQEQEDNVVAIVTASADWEELCQVYETKTQTILTGTCDYHMKNPIKFWLRLALTSDEHAKLNNKALYLKQCLKQQPQQLEMAISMVCLISQEGVESLVDMYTSVCLKTLVEDIVDEYDEVTAGVLCDLLKSPSPNDESNDVCADNLKAAMDTGNLFSGDQVFFALFKQKARQDLKDIFELFLKKCQRDISVEIEKFYCEQDQEKTRDNLVIIVSALRNSTLYLSTRINQLLGQDDAYSQMSLMYIIMNQDKDGLSELKRSYESSNYTPLLTDARDLIKNENVKTVIVHSLRK